MPRWHAWVIVTVVGSLAIVSDPGRPVVAAGRLQSPGATVKPPADDLPQVGESVARYLRVRLRRAAAASAPGGRVTLVADIVPGQKMHVYAPGQRDYISIELTLPDSPDYKAAPPVFPPAKGLYLDPIKTTVQVFDAPFRITQSITLARTPALQRRATAGESLIVIGTLKYQACDDLVCYRPDTTTLSWPVPLGRGQ